MIFDLIKNINPSKIETWQKKKFLTFDIDWASDDVLDYSIDMVEKAGIKATWFVTHDTPLLEKLRKNNNFELGIHPNFNFLFNGDACKGATSKKIIQRLLKIVPEAKSIRSHSLTQSSFILHTFKDLGLTHHCNTLIPYESGLSLKPWNLWNGMFECPHFWEDDVSCESYNMDSIDFNKYEGLKIYDFHPIHVFLNTKKMDNYEAARPFFNNFAKLKEFVNTENFGTRDFLMNFINNDN